MSDLTSDEDEEGVKKSEASISTLASWCVFTLLHSGNWAEKGITCSLFIHLAGMPRDTAKQLDHLW